jgi:hypothetical protein
VQSRLLILQASLAEVSEAYFSALFRQDHNAAREWRKLVIERSIQLSVAIRDSEGIADANGDDEGRRRGAL